MATSYGAASNFTAQFTGPYSSQASAKVTEVTLYQRNWKEAVSPYTQDITVEGVSANSVVDLAAGAETLAVLTESRSMVYLENDGGAIRAVAVGGKPTADLRVQVIIQEGIVV